MNELYKVTILKALRLRCMVLLQCTINSFSFPLFFLTSSYIQRVVYISLEGNTYCTFTGESLENLVWIGVCFIVLVSSYYCQSLYRNNFLVLLFTFWLRLELFDLFFVWIVLKGWSFWLSMQLLVAIEKENGRVDNFFLTIC